MSAQPGNDQRVVVRWQSIDNKVFIRRIIVSAGRAVQATANARQNSAQEWEGFRTVAGYSGKWLTLISRVNDLSAVVLTNFQLVVFRRETVVLIAIWQFAGKLFLTL